VQVAAPNIGIDMTSTDEADDLYRLTFDTGAKRTSEQTIADEFETLRIGASRVSSLTVVRYPRRRS
jgi:hypothetical protein